MWIDSCHICHFVDLLGTLKPKWEWRMDKGKWVKGKESALCVPSQQGGPAARLPVSAPLSFFALDCVLVLCLKSRKVD